jgi:catechol 2,3-dioxygenase-like lactoylglutathione lyase family enzyme
MNMDAETLAKRIPGISHSGFYTENLDRCIEFYTKVLGAKLEWRRDNVKNPLIKMYVGDFGLSIITRPPEQPRVEIPHAWHFAYRVDYKTAEETIDYIKSCGVEVEGPIPNPAQNTILSWFFVDPDEHRLELEATYPTTEMRAEVVKRGEAAGQNKGLGLHGGDDNKRKVF